MKPINSELLERWENGVGWVSARDDSDRWSQHLIDKFDPERKPELTVAMVDVSNQGNQLNRYSISALDQLSGYRPGRISLGSEGIPEDTQTGT